MLSLANFIEKDTFLVVGFLVLIALAALISEKSGIINIALEGQLISASLGYTFFSFLVHNQNWNEYGEYFFAFSGAIIFTIALTLVFAFFVVTMKMDQILTALAINIFMFAFASLIIVYLRNNPELTINADYLSLYNAEEIDSYLVIKVGGEKLFEVAYQFLVVIFLVISVHFFLFWTRWGLHLRSCGEDPQISKINAVSVPKFRYLALILGGILISFAGSLFVEWRSGFGGGVDGYGYFGLAIMILGNRNIWKICFFSLFFTVSQTLIFTLTANDYKELVKSFNYFIPLLLLIVYGIFWKPKKGRDAIPQALGKS